MIIDGALKLTSLIYSMKLFFLTFACLSFSFVSFAQDKILYQSAEFKVYNNRIEQGDFKAIATSYVEMSSNYRSMQSDIYRPDITFKFSINSRDNEMPPGQDHHVTLQPKDGSCITTVRFGQQMVDTIPLSDDINLTPNTLWTIRLDMREVLKSFQEKGFYTLNTGEKLDKADFNGVFMAGNSAPLMWDFNNLHTRQELQLRDPDGDGIFETTLILNAKSNEKQTAARWKQANYTTGFPQYQSDYLISDALYNLALDEMINAVEPDSTFRTGKEWAGVWTRDISYSIILSMASLQPKVAVNSLMRKVKNKRIIQDTGTGGAWPASTDRMIWAVAAWEVYKATGNRDWLEQAYEIISLSIEDDLSNIYDPETGLVKGESSFTDWREQTYPQWMQPADIFESECLSTNAVHYQANHILSKMAMILHHADVADKHNRIAKTIKDGINQHLWLPEKHCYAQFLYGRNFKIASPRSDALGEALCVIFGIADEKRAEQVIANTPVTAFGIPCIYPQIPNIPPYHNNAVWPFVQAFWLWAAASVNNEKSAMESISAIYRPAAMFLTNKENFVAENGDFSGTQINSSNMLWSLSGSISIIHKVLFGIRFEEDKLVFKPFVPEAFNGKRELTNFKYRNAILDIELNGFGNKISSFKLDGKKISLSEVPATISGRHTISIELENQMPGQSLTNQQPVLYSLPAPVVKYENQQISWQPVGNSSVYNILVNGKLFTTTNQTYFDVIPGGYVDYQVIACLENKMESFASEPVVVISDKFVQIIQAEDVAEKTDKPFKGFAGDGFIEISTTVNKEVRFKFSITAEGLYSVDFRYSNGNGPVNTENKCAIRTLSVGGKPVNAVIFPQRGKGEWSNWGFSNALKVHLTKGENIVSISLEDSNANMNGEINQAMIDFIRIQYLD
ncbi:MAG: glycogen debranching protein [Bacteroidetes bacterium]|nr:glycogen debranching protein [Bacteroidota bacterium]